MMECASVADAQCCGPKTAKRANWLAARTRRVRPTPADRADGTEAASRLAVSVPRDARASPSTAEVAFRPGAARMVATRAAWSSAAAQRAQRMYRIGARGRGMQSPGPADRAQLQTLGDPLR